MTPAQRAAIRWAVKMIDALLDLTGCVIKPESRVHLETLREMVR
jgi:hypothetical protein